MGPKVNFVREENVHSKIDFFFFFHYIIFNYIVARASDQDGVMVAIISTDFQIKGVALS